VLPDDVKSLVVPVFAHRVISKTYLNNGDGQSTARILQQLLDTVPAPR
jgi:MoxR-like ATPase